MVTKLEAVLVRYLQGRFPKIEAQDRETDAQTVLLVPLADIHSVLGALRTEDAFRMDHLGDLTAVDQPEYLEIVYHLYSLEIGHKLVVKTRLPKTAPAAPTVTDLWPSANYPEREVHDLFGVVFSGHPNMKRIFLPDGFEGNPLRKEYKLPPRVSREAAR